MRKSSPSPQHHNLQNTLALCVALLSPMLLIEKAFAFFAPAPRGRAPPRIGMIHQGTMMENTIENVALTVETWESFREEDHERFLSEFWQKKPLLIRNALPGFSTLLSKDELAGLACCPDVESRIVSGGRMVSEAGKDWRVEHGPFEEQERHEAGCMLENHVFRNPGVYGSIIPSETPTRQCTFSSLEDTHWTLLVNEVNRHVPEVSDLLNKFRFVPTWRIDDVMVSYAPEGGSVGPHVDSYDVFLLQAAGKRRWSVEGSPISDKEETTRSVQDIDVRVLGDFKESQAWVLEPGDALYLPPRVAHYGVSLDEDCMTYSIGFRAPSARDLVTYFSDHVASTVTNADDFFADPDLRKQENHGLISRDAITRGKSMIREAVRSALDDDAAFDRWFGEFVTRSRRDHTGYPVIMDEVEGLSFGYQLPEDVTSAIRRVYRKEKENASISCRNNVDGLGPFVYHAEGLTFAFVEHVGLHGGTTIFVDGNAFPLPARSAFVAGLICQSPRLSSRDLGPVLEGEHGTDVEELLHLLLREGFLYPADD